jgi:hypothetical protein
MEVSFQYQDDPDSIAGIRIRFVFRYSPEFGSYVTEFNWQIKKPGLP